MGTILRNTIQNTKNDSHFLTITTQSGKDTTNPSMTMVDKDNPKIIDDVDESEVENLVLN